MATPRVEWRTCEKCPTRIRSDNTSGVCKTCWQAVFRETHRAELRASYRAYRRANPEQLLLSWAKVRAKKFSLPFSLVQGDIYIPVHCPLLGIEIRCNEGSPGPDSPTLDRLVPALGYVAGNVRVVSHLGNRIKSNATPEQLQVFAKAILGEGGFRVIETIEGIDCPSCSCPGPHDRLGTTLGGSHVQVRCGDDECGLKWKVTG